MGLGLSVKWAGIAKFFDPTISKHKLDIKFLNQVVNNIIEIFLIQRRDEIYVYKLVLNIFVQAYI